ncbi:histidine kinase [Anoxybacter fermentans]|uniref:Histidine kinase n=1 Tax=Anoxybacter fermentans TaxID=1323375 RepID=A0A3S9T2D0_9FIRM|nr:HutP family protein [Anoxybacter fermentans]AZR74693.1 histidine kinase [Anoxybacter fermentans]
MFVKDIMVKNPITVSPDATLLEAEKLMSVNNIGRLIVVEDGKVIGMLTDSDLVHQHELETKVEVLMSTDVIKVYEDQTVQEAAALMADHHIGGLPVFDREENLVGIVTAEDLVVGFVREESQAKITPESAAIYLSMTRSREYEKYWLEKVQGYGYRAAITQTGASAEKLAIKLRESTTVAAIARGVISENSREKMAVSNAVKDAYSQLALVNPGLGGGFKIAIVRGEGRLAVAIFGKFGHALVDGPEQLTVGTSVI